MDDRKKNSKKGSPVKGGAAANLQVASVVKSHKDDTAVVETTPEAEKVEGEVKADEAKTDVVPMAPIHVVGGEIETTTTEKSVVEEIDPELEREQLRASRKEDLKLLLADNPQVVLASDLSDEDKILVAEILSEQNQVVRDWSAVAEQLGNEKDELERKLSAANSKLGSVTNLISNTVAQTMGQMDKETVQSIEGLKTEISEAVGKGKGVKNAITKIGDDVNKDIGSLKGQVSTNAKSVNDKVDGVAAMLGKIDEKISSNSNANNPGVVAPSSNNWPWVVVVGLLLAALTVVILIFFLSKDAKTEVSGQSAANQQPVIINNILPQQPIPGNAVGTVPQQVMPTQNVGGGNHNVSPILGATLADPCEGKTGKENGECTMNSRRPKDFPDQDWNTVLTVFAEPVSVALEGGGMEACREKYLRATDNEDFALECEAAVKCLVSPEEKRRDCWRIAAESFEHKLGMTN